MGSRLCFFGFGSDQAALVWRLDNTFCIINTARAAVNRLTEHRRSARRALRSSSPIFLCLGGSSSCLLLQCLGRSCSAPQVSEPILASLLMHSAAAWGVAAAVAAASWLPLLLSLLRGHRGLDPAEVPAASRQSTS